jgi:glutamyl-tRNA synthetase
MAAILTVPTKIAPFPYGATALAAYTGIAAVAFEEAAPGLSLDLNGQSASTEDEIIQTLAKAADLAGDSAKVSDPRRSIRSRS